MNTDEPMTHTLKGGSKAKRTALTPAGGAGAPSAPAASSASSASAAAAASAPPRSATAPSGAAAAAAAVAPVPPPAWYRLPLISLASFIPVMSPFYDIREGRHVSKSEVDPIFDALCPLTAEEKLQSQKIKALQMGCGNIHEEVMGRLPGMRMFKNGHFTGCDVGTLDCSWVIELKNHVNTMNGGGRKSVEATLLKQVGLGRRATLCIVNGVFEEKELESGAEEMSGRQLYAELTHVPDFFDILVGTVRYIFDAYPTYASLVETVGLPAVEAAMRIEEAKTPLTELSLEDLKVICRRKRLRLTGTKEDLIKRIEDTP